MTQGCTLGSFFYPLATFPLVKAIQESLGGEGSRNFVKFFVDDGSLCADFDTMTRAIAMIDAEGTRYG